VQAKDRREHYPSPQLRRLNLEQASLFLVGHTWDGDSNARDSPRTDIPAAEGECTRRSAASIRRQRLNQDYPRA